MFSFHVEVEGKIGGVLLVAVGVWALVAFVQLDLSPPLEMPPLFSRLDVGRLTRGMAGKCWSGY